MGVLSRIILKLERYQPMFKAHVRKKKRKIILQDYANDFHDRWIDGVASPKRQD